MRFVGILCAVAILCSTAAGQLIELPGMLTVQSSSTTGTSFTYNGTLTQAATVDWFTQSGTPCMLTLTSYCTNGAGIVISGGTIGSSLQFGPQTFGSTSGIWNYGALLMTISGVGAVQVFPANAANGLGSGAPPANLTLAPTTLSALGFPAFSVTNPTITFVVADGTGEYGDNAGSFTLSPGVSAGTPALPTLWLSVAGMLALASLWFVHKKYYRARSAA